VRGIGLDFERRTLAEFDLRNQNPAGEVLSAS